MNASAKLAVVVTLAQPGAASEWLETNRFSKIVALRAASPSGKRFGSLALGIGIDALLLATKARLTVPRDQLILATNPWIALFLKLLGHRELVSMGIYARPGSMTWKLFRRVLRRSPMIVMSVIEAENWRASGGTARTVQYGNTFPYQPRIEAIEQQTDRERRFRVFVGGSSDRDLTAIERLQESILASELPWDLIIAIGGSRWSRSANGASVSSLPDLPQDEFGRQLAAADLAFLPLLDRSRSAGHMFIVGALQVGTPVIFTRTLGMEEYDDGTFCRGVDPRGSHFDEIAGVVHALPSRQSTHDYWESRYSRQIFVSRVTAALFGDQFKPTGSTRGS